MKSFELATREELKKIKMLVFDVDGVLVPRGTKIEQKGDMLKLQIKKMSPNGIELMRKLNEKGFLLNVNSGRGLYYLQEMFREVLPFASLTYENGSATWSKGKIYQHVNSFEKLHKLLSELREIRDTKILGFEPKEFIITIHCKSQVAKLEEILKKEKEIYWIWNGEAYDIGLKEIQTKAVGLKDVLEIFKLKKENVLGVGDNFNDKELLESVGIAVSADHERVSGGFFVPLKGKILPAEVVMRKFDELF